LNTPLEAERFERRFGGLRRLYGVEGAQRVFNAHAVVVGIGGVGSWAAEALARSGVRRLTLVDLDHVAESNINRQVHASDATLGQAKIEAMRDRILGFHPGIELDLVDEFVDGENWPALLRGQHPDGVIDACDQVRAKTAMAAWARHTGVPFVAVGAAGGKRRAEAVQISDLSEVTHDPLFAQVRQRLRKHHAAPRAGAMGVACVHSREEIAPPDPSCALDGGDGSLNCHGYGSVVTVTASFGLCAAGWLLDALARGERKKVDRPSEADQKHAII
jgi:tRNA A37 threonylcarbamoyladenosine dehydratase